MARRSTRNGFSIPAGMYLGARRRRRLLEAGSSLERLASRSWHEFEMLVGEAFRQHGYSVEEAGLGGADGGIDLVLRKQGRKVLVQCKQWRRRQIGVSVVSGEALLRMIQTVQQSRAANSEYTHRIEPVFAPQGDASAPAHSCPRCGSVLVQRTSVFR